MTKTKPARRLLVVSAAAAVASAAFGAAPERPFATIYAVLESPRCKNCHPAGDAPLQGDAPPRRHAMNVTRTSAASGLACATCHGATNAPFRHGPPGRPGWRLPDAEMPLVFEGRSEHALCEQLKNPAENGGKSLAALEEHFDHDPFVRWGWAPGPGRTVPPVSHADLMTAVHAWIASGAACP
jgi:hypothetical protein